MPTAISLLIALLCLPAPAAPEPPRRLEVRSGGSVVQVLPASPAGGAAAPVAECGPAPIGDPQGWVLQKTTAKVLMAVSFSDPLNGYVAAELGAVYRTTDGGTTWTTVLDLGNAYYWYGVKAFSAQTALIVGWQNPSGIGVGRWTDDGGATWTGDLVIDPANWILGLEFVDAQHGIAFGYQGRVYVTRNGGRTAADWTKVQADPTEGWLKGSFTFLPDMNVFITGIKFCHSSDGGQTWTVRPSADPVFDGGCSFPDPANGWTGGGSIFPTVEGWIHRTADGGGTWSGRLLGPPYPIRSLKFFNPTYGIAVGGDWTSGRGGIWSTADGGSTWTLDLDTGAELYGIASQSSGPGVLDLWCVGVRPDLSGVIYRKRLTPDLTVAVAPATATMGPGQTRQFTATVTGAGPFSPAVTWSAARGTISLGGLYTATVTGAGPFSPAVTWSAARGTISLGGLYTAPATFGPDQVTATSAADHGRSAKATVTVAQVPPTINAFTVSPAAFQPGASVLLAWSVSGATAVSISNGVGSVAPVASATVAPPGLLDATYTLTALNGEASATRTLVVACRPTDLIGDGTTDILDLALLARAHGSTPASPHWYAPADLDGDGAVGDADLTFLLQALAGF